VVVVEPEEEEPEDDEPEDDEPEDDEPEDDEDPSSPKSSRTGWRWSSPSSA